MVSGRSCREVGREYQGEPVDAVSGEICMGGVSMVAGRLVDGNKVSLNDVRVVGRGY
jgi:hypothetical protein